jgi:Pyruvate/2-oxoacid:ferredoxin oxidoreductase gamma subunit
MLPVFPLGVKKDVSATASWPSHPKPCFDAERLGGVIAGSAPAVPRFCSAFPRGFWGDDVALKLAGSGGDGAQTAALLLTRAAINEGFDATHIPSYGPESRGGTSYADVRIAEREVASPAAPTPHALVAFNAPSLAKFAPRVVTGGVVVYDQSVVATPPALERELRLVGVPATAIARELGAPVVKNIVALGALQGATGLFPQETLLTAIRQALRDKPALVAVNERAFAAGVEAAQDR